MQSTADFYTTKTTIHEPEYSRTSTDRGRGSKSIEATQLMYESIFLYCRLIRIVHGMCYDSVILTASVKLSLALIFELCIFCFAAKMPLQCGSQELDKSMACATARWLLFHWVSLPLLHLFHLKSRSDSMASNAVMETISKSVGWWMILLIHETGHSGQSSSLQFSSRWISSRMFIIYSTVHFLI